MSVQGQRGRRVQRKKTSQANVWFYWLIGGILILGAAFLVTVAVRGGFGSDPIEVTTINAPVGTTPDGFYYKGSPDAPVKVVEYADYQCPACATFHRSIGAFLTTNYVETGKVQFIFHDFPLDQHPNAPKAAEAARCAADQGPQHFWQYQDVLFARQSEWSSLSSPLNRFAAYAGQIGLDRGQFEQCLADGTHTAFVAAAKQSSTAAQIPATPTFVVDGQQVDATRLTAAIDAALAARGQR